MSGHRKILVVDDEPDFVQLLKVRLESDDYQVVTALNGLEGLEKLKSEKPDVVLLDIMMPKINGLDVLKKMRTRSKSLPIFMLSGYADERRFKTALRHKASGFIIKSEGLQKQLRTIQAALSIAARYRS